jgi:hypothetical protein
MATAAMVCRLKVLLTCAIFCAACCAQVARAGELSVYVKSGWFTWDEKLNGSSFVKEKGALHGAGITRSDLLAGLSLAETAEVWGGSLAYDGHDLTGATRIEGDTSYLGTREEVSLGMKLPAGEKLAFEPFVGAGHRFWVRTRSGEDWNSIYAKAGLTGEMKAGRCTLYLKGGALLPVYTRSHVSLSNAGYTDVVTEPKSQLSSFAEAGVKRGAFAISVEYEGLRFGQSDKVPTARTAGAPGAVVQNSQAYQPESQSSLLSLKLAYSF